MNITGIIVGVITFLLIGLFHPIVIKAEYYWGVRCWPLFAVLGGVGVVASFFVDNDSLSAIIAVFGITCFWTILELFEQRKRVKKGWFPNNPKRKDS